MDEQERRRVAELAKSPEQQEAALQLARAERFGTLCTQAVDHPGYPFGSIVQYVLDPEGNPIILASELAEHTRNFTADPKVALFVTDTSRPQADPQTMPRVTMLGTIEPADRDEVGPIFREAHPKSGTYRRMADFAFYRIRVDAVRYVGGFGTMSWLGEDEESSQAD